MADQHTPTPMTDADITPPPANAEFRPAEPLKEAGATFEADTGSESGSAGENRGTSQQARDKVAEVRGQAADKVAEVRGQATDKARNYAEDGKARATVALGQLSGMLNDAAGQVDEKLGAQYGEYARTAANKVDGFTSALDAKSVDELFDDARELVRKSPGVAIGAAAAIGFVVARLLTSGIDQRDA